MVWCGVVWCGVVRCGVLRCGVMRLTMMSCSDVEQILSMELNPTAHEP